MSWKVILEKLPSWLLSVAAFLLALVILVMWITGTSFHYDNEKYIGFIKHSEIPINIVPNKNI